MTAVLFEPATGRLRLTLDQFGALVGCLDRAQSAPADLLAAGVLVDGLPHPLVQPGLEAVRESFCQLRIEVTDSERAAIHQGWLAAHAAGFLLQGPDEAHEFICTGPTFAPAAIFRTLDLTPVPDREPAPIDSSTDLANRMFDTEPETRSAAAAAILGPDAPNWRAGRISVSFGEATDARRLILLITPANILRAGQWNRLDGTVRWNGTTTTELWKSFIYILAD